MEIQPIATAASHRFLRRLDYCPTWLALPVGIGAGVLGAVGALTWTPAVVGAALFVLLLGGAALLAWSGEPVARLVEMPAPARTMSGLGMIRIPGGVFRMGSPADEAGRSDNEGPVHVVRVSTFEMMRVPVTRRLYQDIMQPDTPIPDADGRPMTEVSWFDAVQFCNRLSEHQGCPTSGTTQRLGDEAVLAARAATCVAQFMKQPNYQEQLQALAKVDKYLSHIPSD